MKLHPWAHDYMRYTAISMFLAKHKREGEAATWAGNSPNVKEAQATEFGVSRLTR
ncbi:MAG TPA: hypothetical protein VNU68_06955 [Verrucomicrobiae bacterium]|nr:hypothetical protein [Verrucomicrobiae bacterium]